MQNISFEDEVEKIAAKDSRYHRDAYLFLREALDHTQRLLGRAPKPKEIRHVTGQQLLDGIRDYALKQFGPMSVTVFDAWGVRCTEDLGEIVFLMVENGLLAKTAQDSREDFKGGYDFREAFEQPFLPSKTAPAPAAPAGPG